MVIYLSGLSGSAFHELGHILGCRIWRLPISSVQIGSGPSLAVGRLRVGLIPWGGAVSFAPLELSRGGLLMVYLAGPIASTVFVSGTIAGHTLWGWSISVVIVASLQLAISLIPTERSDLSNSFALRKGPRA